MQTWRVAEAEELRLDRLVAEHLDAPRNQVQGWIRDGLVLVDGERRRASFVPSVGSLISCSPRAKDTAANLEPEPGEIATLYADADLIVVDKPAGLAVHPGAGRPGGTLVNRLLASYPEIGSVGGRDRPGIVHRLDMDTTGAMVVARTETAYQHLSRAFADRKVGKVYCGIVFGTPRPESGMIDLPLGRHPSKRTEMAIRKDGRAARTGYSTLAAADGASLLRLELETGRTHQIRVHLKALGHPLVGDSTYAGNRWRGAPKAVQARLAQFERPALHAATLLFEHPTTGATMEFEAPLPADLVALWRDLAGTAPPPIAKPSSSS